MNKTIKNLFSFPYNSKLIFQITEKILNKTSGGYILSFHDVSPEVFESHIESLAPSKPISLEEMIQRYKLGKSIKDCFAITFDDGVRNTVLKNWEICLKNSWPVTFYLPTNYIDGDNLPFQKIELLEKSLDEKFYDLPQTDNKNLNKVSKKKLISDLYKMIYVSNKSKVNLYLDHFIRQIPDYHKVKENMPKAISWNEIRNISKNQLSSFQSHSVSHTAVSALSEEEIKIEMIESKNAIEECTGKKVNSFCYPYGAAKSINSPAVEIASKYFDSATTLIRGRLKKSDLYYLPRIDFYEENKTSFVRLKVALS